MVWTIATRVTRNRIQPPEGRDAEFTQTSTTFFFKTEPTTLPLKQNTSTPGWSKKYPALSVTCPSLMNQPLHRFKAPCTRQEYESLPLVPVCAQAENTPDKTHDSRWRQSESKPRWMDLYCTSSSSARKEGGAFWMRMGGGFGAQW